MPSAQAQITTQNAAVHLARLGGHLTKMSTRSRFPGYGPRGRADCGPPDHVIQPAGHPPRALVKARALPHRLCWR